MKRNEHIEIIKPGNEKLDRKVSNVIGYLGRRSDYPSGTVVVHHRESGGKTHYLRANRGWVVERVTHV